MPVVLAPLAVGFAVIVGAFVLYGLHQSAAVWLRSLTLHLPDKNSLLGHLIAGSPPVAVAKGVRWLYHKVRKDVGDSLVASLAPAAHWLGALGSRERLLLTGHSALAEDVAQALARLRHRTMPREINRRVAPVAAEAAAGVALGRRSISLGRRETKERERSIDRLKHKWLIPLALGFAGIDAFVKGRHAKAHHYAHAHTIPRHGTRLGRLERTTRAHARRLSRLERLIGLGVIAGLMIRTLARVAPWLFCRNWKKIGRAVCGLSSSRVDALLALLVGVLALSNIRTLAQFAEAVEEEAARGVAALVGVTGLSSGRFTIE